MQSQPLIRKQLLCLSSLIISFLLPTSNLAQPGPNDVLVRVIDSGAALCCVAQMPGPRYFIYDAGNYAGGGSTTADKVEEIIPLDSEVELLVLSHSDSDHLGAVDEICDAYTVNRVIRSGYHRTRDTWRDANEAIDLEVELEGCTDINLRYYEHPMGATYRFGNVFITMVCGFHRPPAEWGLSGAEERNAGSIVIRLYYQGRTVLFTGDAVGRDIGDPPDVCIATERFMVDNSVAIPIDSDVLIAPHHGADNGSSTAFIQAVSPEYVIFSAGHRYDHPRAATAQRYIDFGVQLSHMFRTDRGDDEGSAEWSHERIPGHADKPKDDDIDIIIEEDGDLIVRYRN